jgi:hypothetical protein
MAVPQMLLVKQGPCIVTAPSKAGRNISHWLASAVGVARRGVLELGEPMQCSYGLSCGVQLQPQLVIIIIT